MKKLLLTLGLVALTLISTHAQGTINPLNGTLTRIKVDLNCDGIADRNVTVADGITVSVYWGPAGGPVENFAGRMTIGSTEGVLTGLPSILALPGAGDAGTVVSLQMRLDTPFGYFTGTPVKQVTLAGVAGPGTFVWSSTATATRFSPLVIVCPEPSTLALGALAGAFLLFRVRKSTKAN